MGNLYNHLLHTLKTATVLPDSFWHSHSFNLVIQLRKLGELHRHVTSLMEKNKHILLSDHRTQKLHVIHVSEGVSQVYIPTPLKSSKQAK